VATYNQRFIVQKKSKHNSRKEFWGGTGKRCGNQRAEALGKHKGVSQHRPKKNDGGPGQEKKKSKIGAADKGVQGSKKTGFGEDKKTGVPTRESVKVTQNKRLW